MSRFIPQQSFQVLQQNRLKPGSFGKIPVEAMSQMYDRMDKSYGETQRAFGVMREQLAKDISNASPSDAKYLQGMYEELDGVINNASKQNDFHNRVRQVRDMARNVAGDVRYQTIKSNQSKGEEQRKLEAQLAAQVGAQNVYIEGDDYRTHTSVAEDGSVRPLNGRVTRRFDYAKDARSLFEKGTTMTQDRASVDQFVENGGVQLYLNQGAGRVHQDELSKTQFGSPYKDLDEQQQVQIQGQLEDFMKEAGYTKVDADANSLSKQFASRPYLKTAQGVTSGTMQTALTAGSEANDQTIVTLEPFAGVEDGIKKQAYEMIRVDQDLNFLNAGDKFGASRGRKVDSGEIQDLRFSPNIDPTTGHSIVQIDMGQQGAGVNATPAQAGYVTLNPNDMSTMYQQFGAEQIMLMQRSQGTPFYRASLPFLSAMADPYLGEFVIDPERENHISTVKVGGQPITIEKKDGKFTVRQQESGAILRDAETGGGLVGLDANALRTFIGEAEYFNQITQ